MPRPVTRARVCPRRAPSGAARYVVSARLVRWMRGAILDTHQDLTPSERATCLSARERDSLPMVVGARTERQLREAIARYLGAPAWAGRAR